MGIIIIIKGLAHYSRLHNQDCCCFRCRSVLESSDSSQVPLYVIVITVGLMILLAVAMTLIAVVITALIRRRSAGLTPTEYCRMNKLLRGRLDKGPTSPPR